MKHNLVIIGAGMAGLLAANILRRHNPVVLERACQLPHNHSAVLRFRTPAVSDATGIPFKQVYVRKGILTDEGVVDRCTIPLANIYSAKVTGTILNRSIWNMEPEERWIAPLNFVERMAEKVEIRYNTEVAEILRDRSEPPAITTIPMPTSMNMAKEFFDGTYPMPDFRHRSIWTIRARIITPRVDVYQTIYNASSYYGGWYRATIHGDELTIECSTAELESADLQDVLNFISEILHGVFGIDRVEVSAVDVREQKFGKIVPIDNGIRERFIAYLTDEYNIYSLGRFATWRSILLDDHVKDIKQIELMIEGGVYNRRIASLKK